MATTVSALENTIRRLNAIIDSTPTVMVMVDERGQISLINTAGERLFGYSRQELIGQQVELLLPERFRRGHPAMRGDFLRQPEARPMGAGRDLYARKKDGSEIPVEIGLNPVVTPEGIYIVSAIVDLTERKRLEAELRKSNEELEQRVLQRTKILIDQAEKLQQLNAALERSNHELQEFAYIASHDLQAPLRSISGFVQLLQNKYRQSFDEESMDWVNRIVSSILHMQTLIRSLLEFSRLQAASQPFEDIGLQEVVREVLVMLDPEIKDSDISIVWDDLPVVHGDRNQLIQLMQNLVGNAIKYRGDRPLIVSIHAVQNGDSWKIGVTDNGIGIDPKYSEKIFEIFRRLHLQREISGTGIGLAICRRIVQRHGGRIWVESTPGKGSTFYFTLPVRKVDIHE